MADVDEAGVHAVVKEITASGVKAKSIVADLREDANARRIVRETANAFGGLDFDWNHLGHLGPASVEGIGKDRKAPGSGAGLADGKGLPLN